MIPKGIGKLNKYFSLQSGTSSQDESGEVTVAYAHYAYVWGSLRPLSGGEAVTAKQLNEEITYRAEIRYNSSVKTEDRVSLESRTFEIVNILNYDENDEYQILLLKEIK
jgi:SPP1 family predicted phage head-tail adaptor